MPWPKGKPRGPRKKPTQDSPQNQPEHEGKAFQPAMGPKREGGKTALAKDNLEFEMKQKTDETISERDKIGDRFMEQTYGTPTEELSPEPKETPSPSEEELSPETSEEVAPEEEPGEVQPEEETVPISQLKETQNKMHDATTEAANYKKMLDEMSPFVDWNKYQLSTKGEGSPKATPSPATPVEAPSQDLFVTDYDKWHEQNTNSVAEKVIERLKSEFMPQAANQLSEQTEWKRLDREFRAEVKDVFGEDTQEAVDIMTVYINRERKANPDASPQDLYEKARPAFEKRFGQTLKKPGKKVVTLESPAKATERQLAGPEKPMTMDDWDKQNRDFVKFRQEELRKRQGG